MTAWWLSFVSDCPVTTLWLPDDYLVTARWPPDSPPITARLFWKIGIVIPMFGHLEHLKGIITVPQLNIIMSNEKKIRTNIQNSILNSSFDGLLTILALELKLRHYEKATKFEKNLPPVLTIQLLLLSSVKTSGRLFSNFCGLLRKAEFYLS